MQHTDKYNLNIIETTDAFSPEPLNENTWALEAQLDAKAAQTDFADLSGRVGTLEAGRLVYKLDSYVGTGVNGSSHQNRLTFDFMPLLVIIGAGGHPWIRGYSGGNSSQTSTVAVSWENKAVSWYSGSGASIQLNTQGLTYQYLAIGVMV